MTCYGPGGLGASMPGLHLANRRQRLRHRSNTDPGHWKGERV